MSGLEEQVAIVTGAGDPGGLGFAHATHLAGHGVRLVVNDLGGGTLGLPEQGVDPDTAERAARLLRDQGADAVAVGGDIADPATAEAMVDAALDAWGRIDIVVNNAGIASAQFWPDVDPAEIQRHAGVTLTGAINTVRAAWPHFVDQGRGRIVNTGSPACFGMETPAYGATKAGLFGVTRAAAIVGRPHDIGANLILPAALTRLTDLLPPDDFKSHLIDHFPAEAVSPVVAALVHPDCAVTGEAFAVGGGRVGRVVLAASPLEHHDRSTSSATAAIDEAMAAGHWTPLATMNDAMAHLGFPPPG